MCNKNIMRALAFLTYINLIAIILTGCGGSSTDTGDRVNPPEISILMNAEEDVAEIVIDEDQYAIDTSANDGTTIIEESIQIVDETDVNQTAKPASYVFPDGLISFTIDNLDPSGGETITVAIDFPTNYPSEAKYYKVSENGFEEFKGAVIDGNTVTLTLTDGGNGDSDDVLGQITDPGGPARSPYDDNNFSGNWLINFGDGAIYFIGDGEGGIIEHSGIISIFVGNYPTTPGTYHINSDGSFEIILNGDEGPFNIYGQLTSDIQGIGTGEQSAWKLHKILDASVCQGTWSGTLTPFGGESIELSFSVDTSGRISHVSGKYTIEAGRMYKQDEFTVIRMTTDDFNGEYNQISLMDGNFSGQAVNGTYEIDTADNPAGDLYLNLE